MAAPKITGSGAIIRWRADVIVGNRACLSEIDGRIGDGDDGNSMAKKVGRAKEQIGPGDGLIGEDGRSMGPLYGMFFDEMASAVDGPGLIDRDTFGPLLQAGGDGVLATGDATRGDKFLLGTLLPAVATFVSEDGDFEAALRSMGTTAPAACSLPGSCRAA